MEKKEVHSKAKLLRQQNHKRSAKALWTSCVIFLALISHNAGASGKGITDEIRTNPIELERETFSKSLENEAFKQRVINKLAEKKTLELQQQVINNVDNLQKDIAFAKQRGRRNQRIKALFNKVFESNHFSGAENYCAAGATSAYENVTDSLMNMVLKNILVSPKDTPKDLNLFSHPNVSCPAFCNYYKNKLGSNYVDRNTPNFRQILKNDLKPGDILMLKSSQNTSSGMHCVTFDQYKNGQIWVKSLNNESNYHIDPLRVVSVAQISNQFKDELIQTLEENPQIAVDLMAQDEDLKTQACMLYAIAPKEATTSYAVASNQPSIHL